MIDVKIIKRVIVVPPKIRGWIVDLLETVV